MYKVYSNKVVIPIEIWTIKGIHIRAYPPRVPFTDENAAILQFLDLNTTLDLYTELDDAARTECLRRYCEKANIDLQEVREYFPVYSLRAYKNIAMPGLF